MTLAQAVDRILEEEKQAESRRRLAEQRMNPVGFQRWLELMWEHGEPGTKERMLVMFILPVAGLMIWAPVGLCIGVVFLLTLRHLYMRDMKDQPWWLKEGADVSTD